MTVSVKAGKGACRKSVGQSVEVCVVMTNMRGKQDIDWVKNKRTKGVAVAARLEIDLRISA